ncbi:hypothetical protein EVAR_44527_1 [Eumeta japonica]|uniref:Uncharacterized protein n=1 Tax=Eumeta variegata TaxID=151549 RepID=A0A4C1YGM3_EUMVA|nr:hypothetical protein EVAR_44527_1 [Eumeta japonica]
MFQFIGKELTTRPLPLIIPGYAYTALFVQYNAPNYAAVKLVIKALQWHKIEKQGRRRKENFAKETIVIEVAVSEKNSLEHILKIHELTILVTADDRPQCRAPQFYISKHNARSAVIRVAQPHSVANSH